jgi:hypothetical protein
MKEIILKVIFIMMLHPPPMEVTNLIEIHLIGLWVPYWYHVPPRALIFGKEWVRWPRPCMWPRAQDSSRVMAKTAWSDNKTFFSKLSPSFGFRLGQVNHCFHAKRLKNKLLT